MIYEKWTKIIARIIVLILLTSILGGCSNKNDIKGIVPPERVEEGTDKLVLNDENKIHEIGNTSGNLLNGGYVAEKGAWIYYSNISDNSKLYKKSKNGSEQAILSDKSALFINVVDDWIYFYSSLGRNETGIYRVKIDGTKEEKIKEDGISGRITRFMVVDEWIYYSSMEFDLSGETSEYKGDSLYKMKIDGTLNQKITDRKIENFMVDGKYLYYLSYEKNNNSVLYKKSLYGKAETEIENGIGLQFLVHNQNIYFLGNTIDGYLFKMNLDGSNMTKIAEDIGSFNVDDDWIYYTKNQKIHKSSLDNDDTSSEIINSGIYKIKKEGTEPQEILNSSNELMETYSRGIFLTDDSIYCIDMKNKPDNKLAKQNPQIFYDLRMFNINKDDNAIESINNGVVCISYKKEASDDYEENNSLKLSPIEESVYNNFSKNYDNSLLKDLEPLSICRLYLHSVELKDYETQYELYNQDENYLGWAKEEYLKDKGDDNKDKLTDTFKDASTIQIRYSDDASEAVIIFNDGDILKSNENIPESSQIFKLSKNEKSIWKVGFLPIQ